MILGFGSNLGNRAIHLKRAISSLSRGCGAVLHDVRLSRIYESPALTPTGAPAAWDHPFLNCALSGETTLEPGELLRHVQEIERSLGRQDHERWAPRVIDIDILWWNGREIRSDDLTIPHPEILKRSFVLEPLRDLIPDAVFHGETWRSMRSGSRPGRPQRRSVPLPGRSAAPARSHLARARFAPGCPRAGGRLRGE